MHQQSPLFDDTSDIMEAAHRRRELAALVRRESAVRQAFINTVVLHARANWVSIHNALGSLYSQTVSSRHAVQAQQEVLSVHSHGARNAKLLQPLESILHHGAETFATPKSPTRRRGHPIQALHGLLHTTSESSEACLSRMVDNGHPREVLRAVSDCASVCGDAVSLASDDEESCNGGMPLTAFARIKVRAAERLHHQLLAHLQTSAQRDQKRKDIELKALHQSLPVGMSQSARIVALHKMKTHERRVTHLGPLQSPRGGPHCSSTSHEQPPLDPDLESATPVAKHSPTASDANRSEHKSWPGRQQQVPRTGKQTTSDKPVLRTAEDFLSPMHQTVLERYRRAHDESNDTPTTRLLNNPHYLYSSKAKKEMHDRVYLTATVDTREKARIMKKEAIASIKAYHKSLLRRQELGLEM